MIKERLAVMLHGREYGHELTSSEEKIARRHGLIVVLGRSDVTGDLVVFRGALHTAHPCSRTENRWLIDREGCLLDGVADRVRFVEVAAVAARACQRIAAPPHWVQATPGPPGCGWVYTSDLPAASFTICEHGFPSFTGIVVSRDDMRPLPPLEEVPERAPQTHLVSDRERGIQ